MPRRFLSTSEFQSAWVCVSAEALQAPARSLLRSQQLEGEPSPPSVQRLGWGQHPMAVLSICPASCPARPGEGSSPAWDPSARWQLSLQQPNTRREVKAPACVSLENRKLGFLPVLQISRDMQLGRQGVPVSLTYSPQQSERPEMVMKSRSLSILVGSEEL